MNRLQMAVFGCMSLVLLGCLLYPEWQVEWTERLDYEYHYETPGGAPEEPAHDVEVVPRAATRRAPLFPGPGRPALALPPPRRERTGTGWVELGERVTRYTAGAVEDVRVRLNVRKLVWEVVVMGACTLFLGAMFRTRRSPAQAFSKAGWPEPEPNAAPGGSRTGTAPTLIILPPPTPPPRPPGGGDGEAPAGRLPGRE